MMYILYYIIISLKGFLDKFLFFGQKLVILY